MDTKLKNIKYSIWLKLLAILLCVAGVLTVGLGLLKAPYFEYAFQNKDFKESHAIRSLFYDAFENVSYIALKYKNEDNIKSGATLDKEQVFARKQDLLNQKISEISQAENNYNQSINQYKVDAENYSSANTSEIKQDSDNNPYQERIDQIESDKEAHIHQIAEKYDELIKNIETQSINDQIADFKSKMAALSKIDGIYYTAVSNDKILLSNLPSDITSSEADFYSQLPFWVKSSNGNVLNDFAIDWDWNYFQYPGSNIIPDNTAIYLGISPEKYQEELSAYNNNRNTGLSGVMISSAGLLAILLGFVYLIYAAGRKPSSAGVNLLAVDSINLDIALAVSFGLTGLCLAPIFEYGRYLFTDNPYLNTDLLKIVFSILLSVGTLAVINFSLMLARRIKRHEVIKNTLIYKVLYWTLFKIRKIINTIRLKFFSVYDRSPLAARLVLMFAAYAFCILISLLLFFAGPIGVLMGFAGLAGVNVLAGYLILNTFKNIKTIGNGAERIRTGELSYMIPETGISELRRLSMTINRIADGFKNAVESQVKAERMKAELITNVSHDLKTPLTSIITYVDLLKNEGLQSENADKYLEIIDTKSQRLKILTEDLFEAAKASSGNISVNIDRLNIISLIDQGLGELSDKITASGLNFKTGLPSEKLYVMADGKLLWRVIENLLSNVFKYALPNSRVYIDALEDADNVRIVIKNISAYELNIPENELMERFKRGDASRHSEGSGLGLSIAKSLTELQGGSFRIEIDGDLFKATVELKKA